MFDSTLKIGSIEVSPPVVLAPMAGITDWPMRMLCRRFGLKLAYTEMVAAPAVYHHRYPTDALNALKTHPKDRPLGIQLFGPDPDQMAEAARLLSVMEADLIDINMGCPVRKVVRAGSGAALMCELDRAKEMVRKVRAVVKVPLTVKMRSGWDECSKNAAELARICEGEGADAITVHGRTRSRGFAGEADLEAIAEVVQAVGIPVIGNGGIHCAADAKKMMEATGCAGVMVARGARGNPWIFAAMEKGDDAPEANPSLSEKGEIALLHFGHMLEYVHEKRATLEMRKHLSWYSKGIPSAVDLRRELQKLETAVQFRDMVKRYFLKPAEAGAAR